MVWVVFKFSSSKFPLMASILQLNEPRLPGSNTGWYIYRDTDRAIVFIHGVMSNSTDCWLGRSGNGQTSVYWPDLIANDPEFRQYALYLGGYYSALDAREYGVAEVAGNVFSALGRAEG